ncbi:MAG TPA: hypothetical protein VFC23_04740, partial [Thermoanaerobaculia bacterium]|nr:hypothetical protein [Thermoanaerobaculia bacterium]
MPVHQEIDQERKGPPPRRQERGPQVRTGEADPQLFHSGYGSLDMIPGLGGEAQRPLSHGQRVESLGFAGPVAHRLLPCQNLLQHGEGLLRMAAQRQHSSPQVKNLGFGAAVDLLPQQCKGGIEVAERCGGIAAVQMDLGKTQLGDRLLPDIVQRYSKIE